MKSASADGQNQSTKTEWPSVFKIAGAEFEQSVAVAKLAVKLCEVQKRELQNKWEAEDRNYAHDIQTAATESEKTRVNEERSEQMKTRMRTLDPESFVARAWQLIEKAREHVLREQSNAEYLAARAGSNEAAENLTERILSKSRIPFEKLCNKKETYTEIQLPDADTKAIIEIQWKVYRSERGFDDLFWAYWCDIGEKWKDPKQAKKQGKLRFDGHSVQMYSEEERRQLAKLARDRDAWKQRGKQKLGEWKRDGIPPAGFRGLARFRREHDRRAKNLKRKPKRKNRRARLNAEAP